VSQLSKKSGIEPRQCGDPRVLVAVGFGSGFAPWAPGTAGSIAAVFVWWLLLADLPVAASVALVAAACVAGVWIVTAACRVAGVGDDPRIVFDEWLGVWVALIGCPRDVVAVVIGLVLFRLFDIAKPWPVSWADREVGGGFGIVLDDVIAGVLALAVLQLSIAWMGLPTG